MRAHQTIDAICGAETLDTVAGAIAQPTRHGRAASARRQELRARDAGLVTRAYLAWIVGHWRVRLVHGRDGTPIPVACNGRMAIGGHIEHVARASSDIFGAAHTRVAPREDAHVWRYRAITRGITSDASAAVRAACASRIAATARSTRAAAIPCAAGRATACCACRCNVGVGYPRIDRQARVASARAATVITAGSGLSASRRMGSGKILVLHRPPATASEASEEPEQVSPGGHGAFETKQNRTARKPRTYHYSSFSVTLLGER